MIIKQIHFEIEQLLQEQGIFSYRNFTHDEIDTAFNFVTNELVTALLSDNKAVTDGNYSEINQYYTDVTKVLKRVYEATGTKLDNKVYFPLPADYLLLISDASYVYKPCKGLLTTVIKNGKYYKAVKAVKYNNKWYKKDEIFKGESSSNVYPIDTKVLELTTPFVNNRLKRTEDIAWILNDSLHNTHFRSPISELVNNDLIVYINDFEIAKINITYYKVTRNVSFANGVTSEFPDNVIYYLIRKSFEHLKQNIQ